MRNKQIQVTVLPDTSGRPSIVYEAPRLGRRTAKISASRQEEHGAFQARKLQRLQPVEEELDEEFAEVLDPGRQRSVDAAGAAPSGWRAGGAS